MMFLVPRCHWSGGRSRGRRRSRWRPTSVTPGCVTLDLQAHPRLGCGNDCEVFVDYALWFQERSVPNVAEIDVSSY